MTKFYEDMDKIDKAIGDLIEMIEKLGLLPKDQDHCTKVLVDLYDDIEEMTGMY